MKNNNFIVWVALIVSFLALVLVLYNNSVSLAPTAIKPVAPPQFVVTKYANPDSSISCNTFCARTLASGSNAVSGAFCVGAEWPEGRSIWQDPACSNPANPRMLFSIASSFGLTTSAPMPNPNPALFSVNNCDILGGGSPMGASASCTPVALVNSQITLYVSQNPAQTQCSCAKYV